MRNFPLHYGEDRELGMQIGYFCSVPFVSETHKIGGIDPLATMISNNALWILDRVNLLNTMQLAANLSDTIAREMCHRKSETFAKDYFTFDPS